jgi:hypothetical protein
MNERFGAAYSASIAADQVIPDLGERTIAEALAQGEDAKTVWRAVCRAFEMPAHLR